METLSQIEAFLESPAADDQNTWREWFKTALFTLICEGEAFSGKRPLHNSGWDAVLGDALVSFGLDDSEDTVEEIIEALFK